LKYKNSVIADVVAQSCTIQIFAVEGRVPVFSLMHVFLGTSANVTINHILPKTTIFGLHFC